MKKTYFHALATLALLSSCGDNRTNGPDGWYDDEDSLAISESLLTFCNLIKSIEICLLVVLELIESVFQLISC